jgi:hypothetical protein
VTIESPPDTTMPCPVPECSGGDRVVRVERDDGSYSVRADGCAYCGGKGVVTPGRHAAYLRLTRGS